MAVRTLISIPGVIVFSGEIVILTNLYLVDRATDERMTDERMTDERMYETVHGVGKVQKRMIRSSRQSTPKEQYFTISHRVHIESSGLYVDSA